MEALLFLLGRGQGCDDVPRSDGFSQHKRERARERLNGVPTKGGRILLKKAARECVERRTATKGGKEEQKRGFCRGKRERRKLQTSAFAQLAAF